MFELTENNTKSMLLGNPESDTAIICLWTMKEAIAKKIDKKEYAAIGQLYSAERGIDAIARTLLANPQIRLLAITGKDLSKSGEALHDFFANGFEKGLTKSTEKECWKIKSEHYGIIGADIKKEELDMLRKTITVVRIDDISDLDKGRISMPEKKREKRIYERKEEDSKCYMTSENAFITHSSTVVESWLRAMELILKFGKTTEDANAGRVKEVLNLLSVITDEDPDNLFVPDAFPYSKEYIDKYIKTLASDFKEEGISYSYGARIRSYFGFDQAKKAVEKLAKNPNERQAVITLWDVKNDIESKSPPCLNHIWLRIREGKLCMTATLRSNDMFSAYPLNAMALRCLQEVIRKDLIAKAAGKSIGLGALVINSESAHLYENTWQGCRDVVEKYYDKYVPELCERFDPRGNFIITAENGKIKVQFTSADGEHAACFEGSSAYQLRSRILREGIVSMPEHGYYLGAELMKAEIALKLGKQYIQDQPLR